MGLKMAAKFLAVLVATFCAANEFPISWETGDGTGGAEENIGKVSTAAECAMKCYSRKRNGKFANGATVDSATQTKCFCEFGQTGRNSAKKNWRNIFIRPKFPISWATGDGSGGAEENIGKVRNAEECAVKCYSRRRNGKLANGATIDSATQTKCFCEFGQTGRNSAKKNWQNTFLWPQFPISWETGDGTGGAEQNIGKVSNAAECAVKCYSRMMNGKLANGATVDSATQTKCYCEYGQYGRNSAKKMFRNAFIRPQFPISWETGDGTGGAEENIGKVSNAAECAVKCYSRMMNGRWANGATVDSTTQTKCYCEYGQTGRNSEKKNWRNTFIRPRHKAAIKCGERQTRKRVVGGILSILGKWPWQAGIAYKKYPNKVFCGGTLINRQWVLTASHCLISKRSTRVKPQHLIVRLGDHHLDVKEGSEVISTVSTIIRHAYYNPRSMNHDIALLKLSKPIKYNSFVNPICLPRRWLKEKVGHKCYVSGWGRISEEGAASRVLQEAQIPIINCGSTQVTNRAATRNMICAGYPKGGIDTCQGDSGGPFVCINDGQFELIGIVSWGYGCARANAFGFYTKVSHYIDWIKKNIQH